ncbi:hypothetical protein C0J52_05828 [Blattella germanica]|nr:hypothetical protein C0J52_05828 [Blattella germanica]
MNLNTRVLRFGDVYPNNDFNWSLFPNQIKELTIQRYLNDERLEIVVDSCKELRILNVSNSPSISDKSVDNILKLNLLQALYIGRTSITIDGVEKLLLGLSGNETSRSTDLPFTCFGGLYDTNIKTLVENLPNIIELTLFYEYDSALLHLTKLKYLQSMSLRTDHANTTPSAEFFHSLGKQLTCLDIENFLMIDIKCIGENCHTLKCLHISGKAIFDTEIPVTDELIESSRISGLLSVECLCVEIPHDILGTLVIISQCVNVRRLFVSLYGITLEEVLEKVSKYNKMEFLETLCMSPWFFITPEFANYLREKYKNLRACYGDVFGVKRSCGIRFYDWYM